MAKKRLGGHRGRKGDGGRVISANHLDRNFDVSKAQNIDGSLTTNNVIWKFQSKFDKGESQSINDYEEDFYQETFGEQLKRRNETQIKNRHKDRVQTMEQFRRNERGCPEEVIWTVGKAGEDVNVEVFRECFLQYVDWHDHTFPNAKMLDAGLHLDEPNAAPHIHQRQVWFATFDKESGEEYLRVHQKDALEEMGIKRPNPDAKESKYNNAKVTYTKMCREKMMEIAEAHGIEIERVPDDKTKSGLSLLEYKVRTAQEKLAKTKKANEDYVRSLEPEPTKTVKKLGKEKVVDKTPEELERDKQVKAAQAVLKDKDEIAERESKVAERESKVAERESKVAERESKIADRESELAADEEKLSEYAAQCQAEANGKVAKMREDFQQQLDKQVAEFTGEITTLKTENISLKEQIQRQAKSVANAIAIRARTLLEKTLRSFGLQMPSGYTVDEQARAAERYSSLEQTEIPKQATPKTNQDVER